MATWSINKYIDGDIANYNRITDLKKFAEDLAKFLLELQKVDTTNAPLAGKHNFYRGGDLSIYNEQTEEALKSLKDILSIKELYSVWKEAISSKWKHNDVWIHGDVAPNNLLVENGILCGVIDFGMMAVGDPSCDYAIAWTFFDKESRELFFKMIACDIDTINRARGWALWKALITYNDTNIQVSNNAKYTIKSILEEMKEDK